MKRMPVALAQTVEAVLKDMGMDRTVARHAIWPCWEEIVGREIGTHTQPEFFSGKTLFVSVDHSVWLHQLNFLKDRILTKINSRLGAQSVSEIHFRIGQISSRKRPADQGVREEAPVSAAEKEEVQEGLRALPSPELRDMLCRIMLRDLSRKKSRREPPGP